MSHINYSVSSVVTVKSLVKGPLQDVENYRDDYDIDSTKPVDVKMFCLRHRGPLRDV